MRMGAMGASTGWLGGEAVVRTFWRLFVMDLWQARLPLADEEGKMAGFQRVKLEADGDGQDEKIAEDM